MNATPVNPRGSPEKPDDKRSVNDKAFREEMQKIEKVREVDPDEQSRKKNRQLAAQMGDKDDAVDVNNQSVLPPVPHSPLDTTFHQKSSSSIERSASVSSKTSTRTSSPPPPSPASAESAPFQTSTPSPLPSPSYSPPPTTVAAPAPSPTPSSSLPSSNQFWGSVDVSTSSPSYSDQSFSEAPPPPSRTPPPPPEPRSQTSSNQSTERSEEDEEEEPQVGALPIKKKGRSEGLEKSVQPFAEPKEPASKKRKESPSEETSVQPAVKKAKTQEKPTEEPLSIPAKLSPSEIKKGADGKDLSELPLPEAAKSKLSAEGPPSVTPEKEAPLTAPAPTSFPLASEPKKGETKEGPVHAVSEKTKPVSSIGEQKPDKDKEGGSEHRPAEKMAQPFTLPQFDPSIQPLVQAAVTQAAPYLNPETMALYHQMVGTIYVVNSRPGVSTTEIVLNSAAFKDSKFFGSTITIEKYATAPDSLNIRLTGSNEAVNTFNQNLSSLVAAFQNGNFQFRIGRLETGYQTDKIDKPVFRRKEKGEGKDDFKDNQNK